MFNKLARKPPKADTSRPVAEDNEIKEYVIGSSKELAELRLRNVNLQPLQSDKKVLSAAPAQKKPSAQSQLPTRSQIPTRSAPETIVEPAPSVVPQQSTTQKFWKYHILEIGDDLYMTTNPTPKFIYCRNGPSYFIQVMFPELNNKKVDRSGDNGFRLVFKNDNIDGEELVTITYQGVKNGGNYIIASSDSLYENKDGKISMSNSSSGVFEGQTTRARDDTSYCITDSHKTKWSVGPIPQFHSVSNKPKNKRFIYFKQKGNKSTDNRILSCFRPHESRKKKKLIKKLNTPYNTEEHYTDPGDGVVQMDPADDEPNSDKLGWLTVFDDYESLNTNGVWELTVGLSIAVGFADILKHGDY